MLSTHTVLFMDYTGYRDYDRYTATCIPEAMEKFNRDHPGRQYVFACSGLGEKVYHKFHQAYGQHVRNGMCLYQGVCQEGTTEYVFVFDLSEPQSITGQHTAAINTFELGLQEAQAAREESGGFPIDPIGLYQVFPEYRLIKDYTQGE